MYNCPSCQSVLERVKSGSGVFFQCPDCHGRSATVALLRRNITREVVNSLWNRAKNGDSPRQRKCPECSHAMAEVPVEVNSQSQLLDVCTVCQFVWFDPSEYEALPAIPREQTLEERLPQAAREKLAAIEAKSMGEKAGDAEWEGGATPDEWWHWIPGLLGMPIEDGQSLSRLPWMTWIITLLVSVISILSFFALDSVSANFGLIPAKFYRYFGGTLISSFFIHGGIMHLIGNMYFFLVFGDNVEDWLGKRRFLVLLVCSTIMGGMLHSLADPRASVPCIGASGGISGIIAFYALAFPKVKVSFLFHVYYYFSWIRVPAFGMFILWGLLQMFGAWLQLEGFTNVSAMAHIGGALTGVAFWLCMPKESE